MKTKTNFDVYRQKIIDASGSIYELLLLDKELASYEGKPEYHDNEGIIALYRQDVSDMLAHFEHFGESIGEYQTKQGENPENQTDVMLTASIISLLVENYMSKQELSDMLGVSLSRIEYCIPEICVSQHVRVFQDDSRIERYHIKLTTTPLYIL